MGFLWFEKSPDFKMSSQQKRIKVCTECNKTFQSAPALSRHRNNIHQLMPKRLFVCPLCKEPAKNRYFYREHLLKHHGIKFDEEKHVFDTFNRKLDLVWIGNPNLGLVIVI